MGLALQKMLGKDFMKPKRRRKLSKLLFVRRLKTFNIGKKKFKALKESVLNRDNWSCRECGMEGNGRTVAAYTILPKSILLNLKLDLTKINFYVTMCHSCYSTHSKYTSLFYLNKTSFLFRLKTGCILFSERRLQNRNGKAKKR